MSTNTPRTDALTWYLLGKSASVREEEQRENGKQLERELATANERLARLRELAKPFLPSDPRGDMMKHRELRAELKKKP